MVSIILGKNSPEDFKQMQELQKMGVSDEIIQTAYEYTKEKGSKKMSANIIREALSRGKRTDNGEWVYGIYSPYNWDIFLEREEKPQIIIISENKRIDGLWCEIIPETVGRFTGMPDKNGKKIFEGDIILFNSKRNLPNDKSIPEVIKYNQRDCAFQRYPYNNSITKGGSGKLLQLDMMVECEVIGNIHDS
ncbi:MAG: YopX family protein [Oscillospiraceae bacterium]